MTIDQWVLFGLGAFMFFLVAGFIGAWFEQRSWQRVNKQNGVKNWQF